MSPSFDNNRRGMRGKAAFFPVIAVAIALMLGAVVMCLWNAILPQLLRVSRINYWQSVGLLVLCRILFGNFGGKRHGRDQGSHGSPWAKGRMIREKWMDMSEEERSKFKEEWRDRCRPGRRDRP